MTTEEEQNRVDFLREAAENISELINRYSADTGLSLHELLLDVAQLPIWVTANTSPINKGDQNMAMTMSQMKNLALAYEHQVLGVDYEATQSFGSPTLH